MFIKPALSMLLGAYNILNRTFSLSITLYFWRMRHSRVRKSQQTERQDFGVIKFSENLKVLQNGKIAAGLCALSIGCVLGPYYFDERIVTGDSYLQLLNKFLTILADLTTNTIFLNNGVPPRHRRVVHHLLPEDIPDRRKERGVKWVDQFAAFNSLSLTYFFEVSSNITFSRLLAPAWPRGSVK